MRRCFCLVSLSNRFLELSFGCKGKWEGEREGCGNKRGEGGVESMWSGVDCVVWGLLIKLK